MRSSHPVWVRGLKHELLRSFPLKKKVAPRVGAWIETPTNWYIFKSNSVAPRVGAWIETLTSLLDLNSWHQSHPVWVRGLKLTCFLYLVLDFVVAPRVGAWIETLGMCYSHSIPPVAPRVGAWIETLTMRCLTDRIKSHPVWVRGLKHL